MVSETELAQQQRARIDEEIQKRQAKITSLRVEFNKFAESGKPSDKVSRERVKLRNQEDALRDQIAGFDRARGFATGQYTTESLISYAGSAGGRLIDLRQLGRRQLQQPTTISVNNINSSSSSSEQLIGGQTLRTGEEALVRPSGEIVEITRTRPSSIANLAHTRAELELQQSLPTDLRNRPTSEITAIQPGSSITRSSLVDLGREDFAPRSRQSLEPKNERFDFFIRDEKGSITDLNIGGAVRKGFTGFTDIVNRDFIPGPRSTMSSFSTQSKPQLGKGFASLQSFALRPTDPGEFGLFLFASPVFAAETSISSLLTPRTVFRQAPTEQLTISRTAFKPLQEGKSIAVSETRTLTPTRFETRASPLDEFFGKFETIEISPRRVTTVRTGADIIETGEFKGLSIRRTATVNRKGAKEIFKISGRSEEINLGQPLTPVEKRALEKGLGFNTKGIIGVGEDVNFFRTSSEVSKQFQISPNSFSGPRLGTSTRRTAGIVATRETEFPFISQTVSGTSDITKSLRGGKITRSTGEILQVKPGESDLGFISKALEFKAPKSGLASSSEIRSITESIGKQPTPKIDVIKSPKSTTKLSLSPKSQQILPGPDAFGVLRQEQSPFSGTGMFERTEALQTLAPLNMNAPLKEKPRFKEFVNLNNNLIMDLGLNNIQKNKQPLGSIALPRTKINQGIGLGNKLDTPEITITKGVSDFMEPSPIGPQFPNQPFFSDSFRISTDKGIPFNFFPPLGFSDSRPAKVRGKRKFKRKPSLVAVELDITSAKPVFGEYTGLVARPIIKKRRKKK